MELNLPFLFSGLYVNTPEHKDYLAIIPFMSSYTPKATKSALDMESELPDDFYVIKDEAQKERQKIILTLAPDQTPDERFLHSPDEINAMTPEELQKYHDYLMKQYVPLNQQLENSPAIRKWKGYALLRQIVYEQTKEYELSLIKQDALFASSSTSSTGLPYFETIQNGVDRLLALKEPEYESVMHVFSSVYEGESPSFF